MAKRTRFQLVALILVAIVATACAADDLSIDADGYTPGGYFPDLHDPTEAGEELPDDYRQSLPRDAINPVYEPTFIGATGVDWPDDELVIGVDLNGEQRAYPVGFLTWREMVVDMHRGIPTLVTW